ncbi:MAG: hypothetical protein IKQ83_03065 [Lachnospiraceae bacterium]|nr:hypothetical protein [Lachnospiraceae bacterium]
MDRLRVLNRNQIKYIAIIAMVIDHIAWAFVPLNSVKGVAMHFVGRLTGPIMGYFLGEAYLHTRSVPKLAARLGIFAIISWIPFSLFENGRWPTAQFGVIYTLFLGLMATWIWDKVKLDEWIKALIIFGIVLLSQFGDWVVCDVLWPFFTVLYKNDKVGKWYWFGGVCVYSIIKSFMTMGVYKGIAQFGLVVAMLILMFLYNGERGSGHPFHKWFFYIFYPLHLLVLAMFRYGII